MRKKEFERRLRRLSIVPFLLLIVVSAALCFQLFRQRQVALSVDHADQAISETTHIMKLLIDMETGFRGYLLAGQVLFLEPYERAVGSIHSEITALRNSVPNPEETVPKLNQLESSVEDWSSYATTWIQKRQTRTHLQPPFSDTEGKRRMDNMRAQVQDILRLQEAHRDNTTSNYDRQFQITISATLLLSFLAALFIALYSRGGALWIAKTFEESLEETRKESEQYRAIFEGVKDYGMSLLDPNGTILRWNPGAERLTGYTASDVVGKNIASIYAQDELTKQQLQYLLNRANELGKYEIEAWRTRKDGSQFWAETGFTALREAHGPLRGYSGFFRDHSERKQIEQERALLIQKLQEAIRSRDDFLMLASHELNTPLTSLSLQFHMIQKAAQQQGADSEAYSIKRKLLDTFQHQVERLNKLIGSMLDVAGIHSGNLPLNFKPTQFSELVQQVINDYRGQFQEAGCPLDVNLEPNIMIECDTFRIEQAVVNLLTNALRYGCVGPVHIVLKKTEKTALFSVQDIGPGVPKEHQERIFQRFGRVEGIHDQGGLGLGLYISKEFIEAHNGKITIESEPGSGTTFTIELPFEHQSSKY